MSFYHSKRPSLQASLEKNRPKLPLKPKLNITIDKIEATPKSNLNARRQRFGKWIYLLNE